MKHYKTLLIITSLLLIITSSIKCDTGESKPVMHLFIQPLGTVEKKYIDKAVEGINSFYFTKITVLNPKPLPESAYYKPRKRYRAGRLLDFLENNTNTDIAKTKYVIILGLAEADISTTKGNYYDWGILGLSTLYGGPAVVSTFRLKRTKDKNKILERLVKVVNHELGHAFGLTHCSSQGCLMQDAKGTIKTVDNESGVLCKKCKEILVNKKVINPE